MIELTIDWNKKNIWDYVVYSALLRTRTTKALIVAFCVCFAAVLGSAIFTLAISLDTMMSLLCLIGTGLMIIYVIFYYFLLKNVAKKVLKANETERKMAVIVGDKNITVLSDTVPCGMVKWADIAEIKHFRESYYLMTKENALLILENARITSGTAAELSELLERKNSELSKKA